MTQAERDELRRRITVMQDFANSGGVYGTSGCALISKETVVDILALLDERDALVTRVAELSKSRDESIQWRNARWGDAT